MTPWPQRDPRSNSHGHEALGPYSEIGRSAQVGRALTEAPGFGMSSGVIYKDARRYTYYSSMATSSLNLNQLFDVNGLVVVITGGGSGKIV